MGSDGDSDVVHYFVIVGITPTDGSTGVRQVRLRRKRRVSPPPPTATFADVPTWDPFFQFVEALAASGITAGCGSETTVPTRP